MDNQISPYQSEMSGRLVRDVKERSERCEGDEWEMSEWEMSEWEISERCEGEEWENWVLVHVYTDSNTSWIFDNQNNSENWLFSLLKKVWAPFLSLRRVLIMTTRL